MLVSWRAWDHRTARRCLRRPLLWSAWFGGAALALEAMARSPQPASGRSGADDGPESVESLVDFAAGLLAPVALGVAVLCVLTFVARWLLSRRYTWRWVLVPPTFGTVSVEVEASEGPERYYFALEPIATGPALVAGPARLGPFAVSLLWSAAEGRMRLIGGPRRSRPR